jgi:hypothetical protein
LDFQREELSLSTKRSFDLNQETSLGWDLTPLYGAALAPAPTAPVAHSQGDIAAVVIDVRGGKSGYRLSRQKFLNLVDDSSL